MEIEQENYLKQRNYSNSLYIKNLKQNLLKFFYNINKCYKCKSYSVLTGTSSGGGAFQLCSSTAYVSLIVVRSSGSNGRHA